MFRLVIRTRRGAWVWLMWPWSCAAGLFSQPSSGREGVLIRRILHSNNQACPQRSAGWSKVCLQSVRGFVVRKQSPVSGPHHWDRRGLCSAGHQLAGVFSTSQRCVIWQRRQADSDWWGGTPLHLIELKPLTVRRFVCSLLDPTPLNWHH